jgi:putative (di)nucleoside polyphosphate hydrolase
MTTDVIDKNGYRKNVCIVITNAKGKVLLARRISDKGWQFPQGGVLTGETYREAMYRELYEEVGLSQDDIEITTATSRLYFYRLPEAFVNHHRKPICIGQKQKWYLLKLRVSPNKINLNITAKPEFDSFKWIDYWDPIDEVIDFKRAVYTAALQQLDKLKTN